MMKDKICMITGASDGIGKATALALAKLGATVILVCKNREKGEEVLNSLNANTVNNKHTLIVADLGSFRDIRELAKQFSNQFQRLDVMINNAAVFTSSPEYTIDNIELQFAVNHLAPFLLTNLLTDAVKASAAGRIINVSSVSHRFGRIDFEDLFRTKRYVGLSVYEQSKLANVLFSYELARRLKDSGVTVNCMNPGRVRTNIGNKKARGFYKLLWNLNKPFLISPEKGAETAVFLASASEVEQVTGSYFFKCREQRSSALSYREDVANRLWDISAELTALKKYDYLTGYREPL